MKVLITDGEQRSALAAVRALGESQVDVYVGETVQPCLASKSKYCRDTVTYPSPYVDEPGFIRALGDAASRFGIDLILPMTDVTSAVLAEHGINLVPATCIGVVDSDRFWRASDKNVLHRLAEQLKIPTPTTHYICGPAELETARDVQFPCIVKPAGSRVRTADGWMKTAVMRADSRPELERLFRDRPELAYPCMLQRLIEGEGFWHVALCDHGEPLTLFGHRRIREQPPWGGVSVLRESVPLDDAASGYARQLLRALNWHGVAMVEFKRERATGIPYLIETNARFWGSLQLASDAGANFPLQAARLWLGQPAEPQSPYRVGIRSRWLYW